MNNIKRGRASLDSPNTTHAHILRHKDEIELMMIVGEHAGRRRGRGHRITCRIARDAVD